MYSRRLHPDQFRKDGWPNRRRGATRGVASPVAFPRRSHGLSRGRHASAPSVWLEVPVSPTYTIIRRLLRSVEWRYRLQLALPHNAL